MFAGVDLSLADAHRDVWDAKHHYGWWRPITAIREADTDGDPQTAGVPAGAASSSRRPIPTGRAASASSWPRQSARCSGSTVMAGRPHGSQPRSGHGSDPALRGSRRHPAGRRRRPRLVRHSLPHGRRGQSDHWQRRSRTGRSTTTSRQRNRTEQHPRVGGTVRPGSRAFRHEGRRRKREAFPVTNGVNAISFQDGEESDARRPRHDESEWRAERKEHVTQTFHLIGVVMAIVVLAGLGVFGASAAPVQTQNNAVTQWNSSP